MSNQHNKKRNASLVYEFLVRYISNCLVEGNEKSANDALTIIKHFYRPGTELYKEYKLVNALVNTTVSSEHVASSVLSEARVASRKHDIKALESEKTSLIHAINRRLNDPDIFEQHIQDYRAHATTQSLLNMWRSDDYTDLDRRASYEDQILKRLTRTPEQVQVSESVEMSPGANRMLFRVMLKKLNEKYSQSLTSEQKSLLKAYAFSAANGDDTVVKKIAQIKESVLQRIDEELARDSTGYVSKKLLEARGEIEKAVPEQTDECVANFMLYAKLKSELETEDGK